MGISSLTGEGKETEDSGGSHSNNNNVFFSEVINIISVYVSLPKESHRHIAKCEVNVAEIRDIPRGRETWKGPVIILKHNTIYHILL